jgi:hypothetical protein
MIYSKELAVFAESKESGYWLRLTITDGSKEMEAERQWLRNEAKEFVLIFSGILKKREQGE